MSDKLKIKYIFEDSYNPQYVNGAYGSINTMGDFIIHFYFERNPIPYSQSFSVDSGDGKPKEIEEEIHPSDSRTTSVRIINSGIVLNYLTAKEIHRWMGEHLKNFEDQIKDPSNETGNNNPEQ